MKNLIIILISILITFSCTVNAPQKNISYKSAENYFVKNTYNNKNFTEKILTSQKEFDRIFGAASTMRPNGKPTSIDFSKENVLALIHPETDLEVKISPVSLQENDQDIVYSYKVIEGARRSFITMPVTIIIIQKLNSKKITFHRIEE
jgi:uncharacterized protein YxeA